MSDETYKSLLERQALERQQFKEKERKAATEITMQWHDIYNYSEEPARLAILFPAKLYNQHEREISQGVTDYFKGLGYQVRWLAPSVREPRGKRDIVGPICGCCEERQAIYETKDPRPLWSKLCGTCFEAQHTYASEPEMENYQRIDRRKTTT